MVLVARAFSGRRINSEYHFAGEVQLVRTAIDRGFTAARLL